MAETAANLVDRVIPERPARQFVLSLPHPIRYLLGYDRKACSRVLRVFVRAVSGWLRARAKKHYGLCNTHPGGVTFIQRFSSSLALNVHFHTLMLDGVYAVQEDGTLRFFPLPPPTDEDIAKLCATIARRVTRALRRMGKLPDELDPKPDVLAQNDPTLAAICGASVEGLVATGERAGKRVMRLGDRIDVDDMAWRAGERCAQVGGFSLHANVAVPARDRARLERLSRYVARPPIATERLEELPDGRIAYRFRKPWRDGTRAVAFSPHDFIEKLVALVPPPQANLVRYHGVLAPAAKLRARVVRDRRYVKEPEQAIQETSGEPWKPGKPEGGSEEKALRVPAYVADRMPLDEDFRPRRMSWAELMKRVFETEVLECPREGCGGRMKIIATITDPAVISRFLECLDLPTKPRPIARARPPPQLELDFVDPPWQDDLPAP